MRLAQKMAVYGALARHWSRMLTGRSYWHMPQGPGTQFVSGQLLGYFNDLTAQTRWPGPVDAQGIPLVRRQDGRLLYFPASVFQKALGHWDRWLASGRRRCAGAAPCW